MHEINLPESLKPVLELAHNYWWSWNQECYEIFRAFDPELWQKGRTPLLTVKRALQSSPEKVEDLAKDQDFLKKLASATNKLREYLQEVKHKNYQSPEGLQGPIAYFSAEFGIHESLPIYSGGLGVLAGDHVKSASDLGLPMLFVGLFYKNGYFTQEIDQDGQQVDRYQSFVAEDLALETVKTQNGQPLLLDLKLAERVIKVRAFKAKVGRVALYLLDSNVEGNSEADRELTAKLYGGDREMRISQEIILGIGGIKLLQALAIKPAAYHMNEGHSGFFQLERIKNEMRERKIPFEQAKLLCASNCLFTTHTPVPAGNEAFSLPLMHKFFHDYIRELDISWHRFVSLGLVNEKTDYKYFSLTVFALNVSRFYNGVSELHGQIAKRMWARLWSDVPTIDNPIDHITNGVHTQTWMAKETKTLLENNFGHDWNQEIINQNFWHKVNELPNDSIVSIKKEMKDKMIKQVRDIQSKQYQRFSKTDFAKEAQSFLRDDVLTIGFARRFATYKRATLIFKDLKRLSKIVNNQARPVQFIFAGKAHPQDVPGQEYIKEIHRISQLDEFRGKIIMLEGYDMNISSHMVAGVDVWLNNPRRPMEASGTSGQKVPINFGLNFSVLDGWWREGYNGENGWSIGDQKDYPTDEIQDFEDANDFYSTLEETIVPLYYADHGKWVEKCKTSFISTITRYSTDRMVSDYAEKFYAKACQYRASFELGNAEKVEQYISTRRFLKRNWDCTTINTSSFGEGAIEVGSRYQQYLDSPHHHVDFPVNDTLPGRVFEAVETDIGLEIYLGDIPSDLVCMELVITDLNNPHLYSTQKLELVASGQDGIFSAQTHFTSKDKAPKNLRLRYYPTMPGMQNTFELGVCSWL